MQTEYILLRTLRLTWHTGKSVLIYHSTHLAAFTSMNSIVETTGLVSTDTTKHCIAIKLCKKKNFLWKLTSFTEISCECTLLKINIQCLNQYMMSIGWTFNKTKIIIITVQFNLDEHWCICLQNALSNIENVFTTPKD